MEFLSLKKRNLRIVLEPRIAREIGGQRVMQGMTGQFPIGKTAEFEDGVFNTDDPKVIKFLKAHPHYGVDFVANDPEEAGVELSDQAVREQNEKKVLAEESGGGCPTCGKQFKSTSQLNTHMLTHQNTQAA